jgi:hypothetical protein
MANGDYASSLGFTPVPGTKDIRLGYDDINRLADWVATRTTGTRKSAAGRVSIDVTGSGTTYSGEIDVHFPTGRFTTVPRVMATPLTGTNETVIVGTADITSTGCTIHLSRDSNTTTGVDWIAMENG